MLRGLSKLTWIEAKVFVREPMGVIGTLGLPVVMFIFLGRTFGTNMPGAATLRETPFNVPVLSALLIAINAVTSLVAIMAIYREGGILKRLRATPLSPVTILSAHVIVKLAFTVVGLALLVVAGRRMFPGVMAVPLASFTAALLLSTLSILSLGFIVASLVPTARFAQPISSAIFFPMVAISGLFFPLSRFPPWLRVAAGALPTTHAVSLMQSVWNGTGWAGHWADAAALVIIGVVSCFVATRVFRWE
jgi:ABC-2 type transport system permease protein